MLLLNNLRGVCDNSNLRGGCGRRGAQPPPWVSGFPRCPVKGLKVHDDLRFPFRSAGCRIDDCAWFGQSTLMSWKRLPSLRTTEYRPAGCWVKQMPLAEAN